ncbi:MAG: sucrose phosphorylase [Lachnospiraceae bacterium]|jgi:sucrose phosphorylase
MPKKVSNKVMLITYADSLGINLSELSEVLEDCVGDAIGRIHLLPFYPSSADKGFAPLNYEVDSAFGTWADVESLSRRYSLSVDYEINHLSAHSPQFLDYLKNGDRSPFRDFFIRAEDLWPGGEVPEKDLEKIFNLRPGGPFSEFTFADGTVRRIWSTFGEEMVDLNVQDPGVKKFHRDNLRMLSGHGAAMIRLDALGYIVKKPGTACYFEQPEVWDLLEEYRNDLDGTQTDILPEVHGSYFRQMKLAERGYITSGSGLPLIMLQALYFGDAVYLRNWMKMCPHRQFTFLDTHDGIGIGDAEHLLPDGELQRTLDKLFSVSPVSKIMKQEKGTYYTSHQVNCTFFTALEENEQKYLCARAIQFFIPGVPVVYYMGLLAATNDYSLLVRTLKPRDINRSYYTKDEAEREMRKPVVQKLLRLMKFRNSSPAFDGAFSVSDGDPYTINCSWTGGISEARLHADLRTGEFEITSTDGGAPVKLDLN